MKNLAIFASGNGSNFQAIAEAIKNRAISGAEIKILIVDHKDAYAIERAKSLGIPYCVFELKQYKNKEEYEKAILNVLRERKVDLICLAGYMKIISDTLLNAYPDRIINIHPALLPSFKGAHGIQDAFDYGCKVYGVTIHYVSKELDGGKIIAQRGFEYYEDDIEKLEKRIHEVEHVLYPETINRLIMEEKI
jgi:phosphoribosylglycinamide formyltransferase 1